MRLVFSPASRIDLLGIQAYIAKDKPESAATFVDKLEHECKLLTRFPEWGAKQDHLAPELRRTTYRGYAIYYLVLVDKIRIVRVLHPSLNVVTQTFD